MFPDIRHGFLLCNAMLERTNLRAGEGSNTVRYAAGFMLG
jgi:hypothetical protein